MRSRNLSRYSWIASSETIADSAFGREPVKILSWNIARRAEPWRRLLDMDADVALLQEAAPPPDGVVQLRDAALPPAEGVGPLDIGPRESWDSHSWNSGWWRERANALFDRWPMVVKLSDRVEVEWFKQVGPTGWPEPEQDEIAVSGIGTIAAARVTPLDGSTEPFIVVSMYGRWIGSHLSVKKGSGFEYGIADGSAHRIISDISAFIGHRNPETHRILAAGDLNIAYGHGYGDPHWEARHQTVFDRMEVIGLEFMGPQLPDGRQAETLATGEPADSRNVVTYYLPGKNPETASNNQLDYVFASRRFHESIRVRALNSVEEWGPSDHCRIEIEVS